MKAASAEMGWPLPDVIIDGEVIEADPPHKLVTTWRMLMDPTTAAEGFTTPHLRDQGAARAASARSRSSTSSPGAPTLAALVAGDEDPGAGGGGGHPWVLSDLKSLLETGTAFSRPELTAR